jgi:hypothetical protein
MVFVWFSQQVPIKLGYRPTDAHWNHFLSSFIIKIVKIVPLHVFRS